MQPYERINLKQLRGKQREAGGKAFHEIEYRFEAGDRKRISMTLFQRNISVEVFDEGENLRLVGRLDDTRLGAPLHSIEVELLMTVWEGEILEIKGSFPVRPMEECVEGLGSLQALVGAKIQPGFSELVQKNVNSRVGCSHLGALMMTIGNTSVQGRGGYMRKHMPDEKVAATMLEFSERLNLLNSCVGWREDGPLMKRWRESQGQP